MSDIENMADGQFVFGSLLIVANRMDTLLERALGKYDVTSKQWFLSIMLYSLFETPPTIKELAKQMGSSHQNVKQVALKLQEKGLVRLEKDSKDQRVTRVSLTEKSEEFWAKTTSEGDAFMRAFFKDVDKADLAGARSTILKLMDNLDEIEETYY